MATSDVDRGCGSTDPLPGVKALGYPSADLFDRALAGWERFLDTFEVTTDE